VAAKEKPRSRKKLLSVGGEDECLEHIYTPGFLVLVGGYNRDLPGLKIFSRYFQILF
jgi:hypothetical protein